jgi:hypothetical protein
MTIWLTPTEFTFGAIASIAYYRFLRFAKINNHFVFASQHFGMLVSILRQHAAVSRLRNCVSHGHRDWLRRTGRGFSLTAGQDANNLVAVLCPMEPVGISAPDGQNLVSGSIVRLSRDSNPFYRRQTVK